MNIKWEELGASVPVNQNGHTAVLLDSLVYVGGDYGVGLKELYAIYCYNLVNNSWGSLISIPRIVSLLWLPWTITYLLLGKRKKVLKRDCDVWVIKISRDWLFGMNYNFESSRRHSSFSIITQSWQCWQIWHFCVSVYIFLHLSWYISSFNTQ